MCIRDSIGHFRYVECTGLDECGAPGGDIAPFADVLFPYAPGLRTEGVALDEVRVERTAVDLPVIEERYTIDAAGIIEFSITDLESGFTRQHRFVPQS